MTTTATDSGGNTRSDSKKLRFGTFEVDLRNRELRNRGLKVRLQEKPFRILELLLARPGELVSREELVRHLWPNLNVNFERSLNTALNLLRGALGDSPRVCRFIETRSGLGYRFIAPVEKIAESNPVSHGSKTESSSHSRGYEDYLKGRHFCEKRSEDALRKSVAHFQAAIAQDSHSALAYAGMAEAYTLFAYFGMLPPIEAGIRAKDCAAKALQLDGAAPESHVAAGAVRASFEWDWTAAETEYLRALELKPNDPEACRGYAALLARMGRESEATRLIRHAHNLNPLSLVICAEAGWILCLAGEFEAAIEQCWKALTIEEAFAPAQYALALAYQRLDKMEEAITEFENARTCSGDSPVMAAALAHAYADYGRKDEALAILRRLEEASKVRYISRYWTSLIWTALGVHDRALEQLATAYAKRDVWLTYLGADPRFDILRSHGPFRRLIKLVGLSEDSCSRGICSEVAIS